VAIRCPACEMPILEGVLRCRHCGADAREPARTRGIASFISLWDVAPDAMSVAKLLDELEAEAPEVGAWFRRADWPRRDRVIRILISLRDLPRRG
jgi:hypothetical protein